MHKHRFFCLGLFLIKIQLGKDTRKQVKYFSQTTNLICHSEFIPLSHEE